MTEAEKIAKGLDKTRRKALFTDTRRGDFSQTTLNKLLNLGLISEDWHLTPLGEAVKVCLENENAP